MRWIVDGNNVMGSRPDGWWRDRSAAARRLVTEIDRWQARSGASVLVVFDGRPDPATMALSRLGLDVRFAPRPGPDAADDAIVDLVHREVDAQPPQDVTVVTADRGLRRRLPAGIALVGPRHFLDRLADGEPR